jgi:SAM-dependent methyltransferase
VDIPTHNRSAWDRQVANGNRWTVPVPPELIVSARRGEWSVVLTPRQPVPRDWFGEIAGARWLALASGGGQQAPIFAAAGADVTVLDNSSAQLAQDRFVAERDGLRLDLQLGEMTDLSRFSEGTFDLIFHPCANVFIPDVRPMWHECFRVLRRGGRLLVGFTQPVVFLFDPDEMAGGGDLMVRHQLPYADTTALSPEKLEKRIASGETLEFGHTLTDQIGGQLDAGFVLRAFYEDTFDGPLDRYISTSAATLGVKP